MAQDARPDMPPDADLPGHPGRTLREYKSLMERCWSPQSAARPSFKQVVDEFQVRLVCLGRPTVLVAEFHVTSDNPTSPAQLGFDRLSREPVFRDRPT